MTLSSLVCYPVKSARGHALDTASVDRFGLVGDRRWMLIDNSGTFVSQRTLPSLALLDVESLAQGLRLTFGGETVRVDTPRPGAGRVLASVWADSVSASVADAGVNDWLSRCFAQPLRLVYYPDDAHRAVEPGFAPDTQLVSFADGYPLLVVTQSALDELNEHLSVPVPMDRFRPNLVISGAAPHAEDEWQKVRIGSTELSLVKPCSRCAIPSIDQQSAKRDSGIIRELARYRRRDGEIYFGMNAVAAAGAVLRTGDEVEVVAVR